MLSVNGLQFHPLPFRDIFTSLLGPLWNDMGSSSKSGTDISLPCSLTFRNISLHGPSPPNSYLKIIYWFIYLVGRSWWPRGLRSRFAAVHLLRLRVRIPPGAWMSVSCVCCVSSGYRPVRCADPSSRGVLPCACFCVWSWNNDEKRALPHWKMLRHGDKITLMSNVSTAGL